MNELTCFSDDNRDECHLSHTTRCNWAVKHAVHISKLSDGVVLTCKIAEYFQRLKSLLKRFICLFNKFLLLQMTS